MLDVLVPHAPGLALLMIKVLKTCGLQTSENLLGSAAHIQLGQCSPQPADAGP
jgi:hypothetical protein